MIRNAVIHIMNEQPLVADLFEMPAAGDVGLRCTNLRTLSGTRPIFADHTASVFFFPYGHIRFVEIPPASLEGQDSPSMAMATARNEPEPETESELEIDEDLLRRIRDI